MSRLTRLFTLLFSILLISSAFALYTAYPIDVNPDPYVKPNLVFVLDLSGSMNYNAYGSEKYKIDNYDPNKTYIGIFNSNECYAYNKKDKVWEALPYDCGCHVNGNRGTSNQCVSGNYLNWLSASRKDVETKILIGGSIYNWNDKNSDYWLIYSWGGNDKWKVYDKDSDCKYIVYKNTDDDHSPGLIRTFKVDSDSCFLYDPSIDDKIGKSYYRLLVKVPKNEYGGLIQKIFNSTRITVFIFGTKYDPVNSTITPDKQDLKKWDDGHDGYTGANGTIVYAFWQNNMTQLLKVISQSYPNGYTPTGTALLQVYDWLAQSEDNSTPIKHLHNPLNNIYFCGNKTYGCYKDPYYVSRNYRNLPDPYKKTYIVLLSDGEWYKDNIDPVISAYYLHNNDLRPDLLCKQNVSEIYAIYTFSYDEDGQNSLRGIAAYGSFLSNETCSQYPYPYDLPQVTSFKGAKGDENSQDLTWPRKDCNPEGSYNSCCLEWDYNKDGIPDTYFLATDGKALNKVLIQVLGNIVSTSIPVKVSQVLLTDDNRFLVGAYFPREYFYNYTVLWTGHLLSYKVFSNGTVDTSNPLWDAGRLLALRNPDTRHIFTFNNREFNLSNWEAIQIICKSLDPNGSCSDYGEEKAKDIVEYIRGYDLPGYRNRTIDDYGDTWKLGDIVHSKPLVVNYGNSYVIFVGANDGMLHAFNGTTGQELWAYIPKNVLPYLKYYVNPLYSHMYFVDGNVNGPFYTDYNGDGKKETVIVASMGLGGAIFPDESWYSSYECPDCPIPPKNVCDYTDVDNCLGLSSYFFLDVTNPKNPKLIWEFTDKYLGLTYPGITMVHKLSRDYFITATGPATPYGDIGGSHYTPFLYILDLKDKKIVRTLKTGFSGSFAGLITKQSAIDINGDGITDYVAFGLNEEVTEGNSNGYLAWVDVTSENPNEWYVNWTTSISAADMSGITGGIAYGRCFNHPMIFFGTGQYFKKDFYELGTFIRPNKIFGIPIICSNYNKPENCRPNVTLLNNNEDINLLCSSPLFNFGWYKNLDSVVINGTECSLYSEREIDIPIVNSKYNTVVFKTIQPYVCKQGGYTNIYVLSCASGLHLNQSCGGKTVTPKGHLILAKGTAVSTSNSQVNYENFITTKTFNLSDLNANRLHLKNFNAPLAIKFLTNSFKGKILLWLEY